MNEYLQFKGDFYPWNYKFYPLFINDKNFKLINDLKVTNNNYFSNLIILLTNLIMYNKILII